MSEREEEGDGGEGKGERMKEGRKIGIKEQISLRNIRNLEMMEMGIHNSQEKIVILQMPSRYVSLYINIPPSYGYQSMELTRSLRL